MTLNPTPSGHPFLEGTPAGGSGNARHAGLPSWDDTRWADEATRERAARHYAQKCWGCSHYIHAPDQCTTSPTRLGWLVERQCACPIDGGRQQAGDE